MKNRLFNPKCRQQATTECNFIDNSGFQAGDSISPRLILHKRLI